jgi:hypothetical protein
MSEELGLMLGEWPADLRGPRLVDWTDWGTGAPVLLSVALTGARHGTFLLLVQALVESYLCGTAGIKSAHVDAFAEDIARAKQAGALPSDADPGNLRQCPYWREHQYATMICRLLAEALGVSWDEFQRTLSHLP